MTTVAITGLAVGFALGLWAAHLGHSLKRTLRRKVNRVFRSAR